MTLPVLLCDVDGVVADLIGGFSTFIRERFNKTLKMEDITRYNIGASPALKELDKQVGLMEQLEAFLAIPDAYQKYVLPVTNSVAVLPGLRRQFEVVFLTATMTEAPESFATKARWCQEWFGDIPMISCPAHLKHRFEAAYMVDDRSDTCQRFASAGTAKPLLFRQPWNEVGPDVRTFDWREISEYLKETA